jgi:ribosomal-protein-alanine N-acetyltransferase
MQAIISTKRVCLKPLTTEDAAFIYELVNTEGWIRFIGDRNVRSHADALHYVQKVLKMSDAMYWVVRLSETQEPTGIITLLKRDYLEHFDLGFAFLPAYQGKGYAFEAAQGVLHVLAKDARYDTLLATVLPENATSIRLLQHLGFAYDRELQSGLEKLHVYRRAMS